VEDVNGAEETEQQRLTRNVSELLGELRVAQAGVQILFGFLLAVVFTGLFRDASGFEKALHLVAVLLAVSATALLSAPAAWHRVLFRAGRRYQILRIGNRLVLAGLACLALAVTVTVALIAKVVFGTVAMIVLGLVVGTLFAYVWFIAPLRLT
jgi:O-antigen/teichoic acid export membrane protein